MEAQEEVRKKRKTMINRKGMPFQESCKGERETIGRDGHYISRLYRYLIQTGIAGASDYDK